MTDVSAKLPKAAQKNRRALWELIRKHKIDVRRFKPTVTRTSDNGRNEKSRFSLRT